VIEIGFLFGSAIYGIIWFLTLFMVLPFGVVSQHEDGRVVPGSEAGAPARPMIYRKLAMTTLLSAVLYGLVYMLLTSSILAQIDLPFLPDLGLDGR
jgi:predicted secreted protein